MSYGPTSPLGGIRIFYSLSILWDSDLSSIRVKWILPNLTLGSRYHFHPESPLLRTIVCCTWRPWRYFPLLGRELVFIAFAIPLPPSTLMGNYLQLLFLYHPQWSCYYKIPWKTRRGFDNPLSLLPCCSCHLNTPTVNSRTYRVSAHPPVVHVLHKSLRNTTRYSKNPQQPIALEFLVCFHYD